MEVIIINKPSFTVVGKMGQGLSNEGQKWIPPLWNEATANFNEIKPIAKVDDNGEIIGIWGAMSDIDEKFNKWGKEGKYLAGCEVVDNATPPLGWSKWQIPGYSYATINCSQKSYGVAFKYMIDEYLPQNNYNLIGAVHEFYPPNCDGNKLRLYFPIAKQG